MTVKDKAIVARWRARLAIRNRLLWDARRRHGYNPTPESRALIEKRKRQVSEAERVIARRSGPKIRELGVTVIDLFGGLGTIARTIGHYTAGPRDRNDDHAIALWRQYHAQHASQGWGGIGYHYGITSAGTIVLLRPVGFKGAHTAGTNTGSVGIVVHGTLGETMTRAQRASLTWLYDNAHTSALPFRHRASRSLRSVRHAVHKDFNATSCPGSYESDYKGA
jgi:hypothetical protein